MSDVDAHTLTAPTPLSPTATPHFHALDGLRGVVAFGVALYHYHKEWMLNGPMGVDVFFIPSGLCGSIR
jgi:peptidoglycan/LPS O-acetylase OafA/YrhL